MIAVGSTTNDFSTEGAAEPAFSSIPAPRPNASHRQLLGQYLRAHTGHDANNNAVISPSSAPAPPASNWLLELHHAAQMLAAYGLDRIRPEDLHISLVKTGPQVLPALPERISQPVRRPEQARRTGDDQLGGEQGRCGWPLDRRREFVPATSRSGGRHPGSGLPQELDGLETTVQPTGRRSTLQTTRDDDIFAFGDCAAFPSRRNRAAPAQRAAAPRPRTSRPRCW